MSDTISRQAAIDAAIEAVDEWDGGYNLTRADMIADAINNNVPSAQPEQKTGKWIDKPDPYEFFDKIPVCSNCGHTPAMMKKTYYCANCVRRMESEEI